MIISIPLDGIDKIHDHLVANPIDLTSFETV